MIENFNETTEQKVEQKTASKREQTPIQQLKRFLAKSQTIQARLNEAKNVLKKAQAKYDDLLLEKAKIDAKLAELGDLKI